MTTTAYSDAVANDILGPKTETLLAVGLTSFAALLLELSLTRLFSVVLFYHFAFLVISLAMLGLGAGGVCAYLLVGYSRSWPLRQRCAAISCFNAISIIYALYVVLHTPVSLSLDWRNVARLSELYIVAAVPFFFIGLVLSMIFAGSPGLESRLYGVDLLGGAFACLVLVPCLNILGAPNTILCAAASVATAGLVWSWRSNRVIALVLVSALILCVGLNRTGALFDVVYAKGVKRQPPLFAKWNAISRVEVDGVPHGRVIVIDADASTPIVSSNPFHPEPIYRDIMMSGPPSMVNILRPRGSYAVIGPGGGPDIFRALVNGSRDVTGIEINPIIVDDIMRDRFAIFAHHVYNLPEVRVYVGDGRSFIRRSTVDYDVIQMTLVDTWASTAAGAFALSENNLYTVEAFKEYFNHLKPDGMLAITRWEFARPREALRVVAESMQALHELGVRDTSHNFIVVSDGDLDADGRQVLVLAKKSAFTQEEQQRALEYVEHGSILNRRQNLHILYIPHEAGTQNGHPIFEMLIRSEDPFSFSRQYSYNVAPVRDNAPFFFFTLKTNRIFSGEKNAIDWKVNLGVAVLGVLLLISIVAVLALLVLPLTLSARARAGRKLRLLYFVAIGLGYILVEIVFIQRFVLFLGHPTYALTVVVFLMLLSSGVGSLLSEKWFKDPNGIVRGVAIISCGVLVYVLLVPHLLIVLVGWLFIAKLVVSAVLLVPLGFVMGMPFPTGLRALATKRQPTKSNASIAKSSERDSLGSDEGIVEWAWAMNAGSSVLGSVLAIVVALQLGLNVTLLCAALAYLLAMALVPLFKDKPVAG